MTHFRFRLAAFAALFLLLLGNAAPAQESGGKALFILDASGSMWAKLDGRDKIAIAKEVMSDLVRQLPDGVEVGLEAYGHRSKGKCDDIEMLAPVAAGNRDAIIGQLQALQPKGKTPIAASLLMAADSLKDVEEQASIILVSDGKETCGGDPCAAIRELKARGFKAVIHVVGFNVKDDEGQQLQCIADAGGGKYFAANDARELGAALAEVKQKIAEAKPAAPVKTTAAAKTGPGSIVMHHSKAMFDVADQTSGQKFGMVMADPAEAPVTVPPGTYRLVFDGYAIDGIEVAPGENVVLEATSYFGWLTAGTVKAEAKIVEVASGETRGKLIPGFSNRQIQLPAGAYKLQFDGYAIDGIEIKAGEELTLQ